LNESISARINKTDLKESAIALLICLPSTVILLTTFNKVEGFLLGALCNGERCCHAL
jgi:hypothetical protein